MTPDPLERLAAELACRCIWHSVSRDEHLPACWREKPKRERERILQALRAARRLGAEEMREAAERRVLPLSGPYVAERIHNIPLPDPEPTESER